MFVVRPRNAWGGQWALSTVITHDVMIHCSHYGIRVYILSLLHTGGKERHRHMVPAARSTFIISPRIPHPSVRVIPPPPLCKCYGRRLDCVSFPDTKRRHLVRQSRCIDTSHKTLNGFVSSPIIHGKFGTGGVLIYQSLRAVPVTTTHSLCNGRRCWWATGKSML